MVKKIRIGVKFYNPYDANAIGKCTAAFCISKGLMKKVDEIPNNCLLLYPFSKKPLSKKDRKLSEAQGVYIIDAPWELLRGINSKLSKRIQRRKLVNVREIQGPYTGSNFKISSAGAVAFALFVLGFRKQAEQLIGVFSWKDEFIKENFKQKNGKQ